MSKNPNQTETRRSEPTSISHQLNAFIFTCASYQPDSELEFQQAQRKQVSFVPIWRTSLLDFNPTLYPWIDPRSSMGWDSQVCGLDSLVAAIISLKLLTLFFFFSFFEILIITILFHYGMLSKIRFQGSFGILVAGLNNMLTFFN